MAVRIRKTCRGRRAEAEWLLRRARRHIRSLSLCLVPGAAALRKAELSVLLTSDREIRKLNKEWRGKDKPTDVLSFPLADKAELRRLGRLGAKAPAWELGDIVISVDRALEQCREHGVSLRGELDLLLAHGLLHLLGFDHEKSETEATRMRRWEKRLIGSRGLV